MHKTPIRWTDYASNPVKAEHRLGTVAVKKGWACSRVSPGCDHCYAATINRRVGTGLDYTDENLPKVKFVLKPGEFNDWSNREKFPPGRIFVCDMTDLFHERVPADFQTKIFSEMYHNLHHTYQLLTKRPGIMSRVVWNYINTTTTAVYDKPEPLPENIWIGTSVEDKLRTPRIKVLRKIPAKVHFLSIEPLLEDLGELDLDGIEWVIVGGESGIGYRLMQHEWALNIRDQCKSWNIPFFFKQSSGPKPENGVELDGRVYEEYPDMARISHYE